VKGGQLAAAAYPARMLALMISDVPGDDPAFIGSGPTVGDRSTPAQAEALLDRWGIAVPGAVRAALGRSGVVAPGDARLGRVENVIYAAPAQSLAAATEIARAAGVEVRLLGDALEGEAREVAAAQAAMALEIAAGREAGDAPVLLLSGGELTVTRRGNGVGGPNAEFCLALALALDGAKEINALACDTDGVDGAAEVAGAVVTPETLAVAAARGVSAQDALAAVGGQVVTGPTLTNVNDFRAILIG
jgi:glycerate 2-kinase